jgi:hypothetical protein
MDLLKLIKDKCDYFSDTEIFQGLESVISHIEIAERHLEMGKGGDDYLFTDVIYRTNQAFEGSLKEAYGVLAGDKSKNLTPHKIEQYFEQNNLLKERVLSLFTNYRTEWRNKSTHDYELYFTEQEAFLAIINICAFFNILLDQIIEKKAYDQEKSELSKSKILTDVPIKDLNLIEQISQLLVMFSKDAPSRMTGVAIPRYFETQLIGALAAYLNSADEKVEVITEYQISASGHRFIADMLVKKGDRSLLIEIKAPLRFDDKILHRGREQLFSYMASFGITDGILYIPPVRYDTTMITNEIKRKIANIDQKIVEIFPEI